jgi:hypothetical protein
MDRTTPLKRNEAHCYLQSWTVVKTSRFSNAPQVALFLQLIIPTKIKDKKECVYLDCKIIINYICSALYSKILWFFSQCKMVRRIKALINRVEWTLFHSIPVVLTESERRTRQAG